MRRARAAIALDPRLFGRRQPCLLEIAPEQHWAMSDMRLFAATFAAGFLFVSILIA
jgi:hypothetical protein